jgi:hypothetical protein
MLDMGTDHLARRPEKRNDTSDNASQDCWTNQRKKNQELFEQMVILL